MAKTTVQPKIEFTTFEHQEKPNPYDQVISDLAAQDNENAAIVITVAANEQSKHQLLVQKAANAIGKTARRRIIDDSNAKVISKTEKGKPIYDGTVTMTFTLTGKHKGRRSKGDSAE